MKNPRHFNPDRELDIDLLIKIKDGSVFFKFTYESPETSWLRMRDSDGAYPTSSALAVGEQRIFTYPSGTVGRAKRIA